jgi:hypothetical protein
VNRRGPEIIKLKEFNKESSKNGFKSNPYNENNNNSYDNKFKPKINNNRYEANNKNKTITIIEILTKITNSSTIISIKIAIILQTIQRIKIENRIITTLDINEAKDTFISITTTTPPIT